MATTIDQMHIAQHCLTAIAGLLGEMTDVGDSITADARRVVRRYELLTTLQLIGSTYMRMACIYNDQCQRDGVPDVDSPTYDQLINALNNVCLCCDVVAALGLAEINEYISSIK